MNLSAEPSARRPPRTGVWRRRAIVLICGLGLAAWAFVHVERTLHRGSASDHRVTCASHLRQIGQYLLHYADQNQGQLPASLGDLLRVKDEDGFGPLPARTFICHERRSRVPADWDRWTLDQQIDWVNSRPDYLFLTPGRNLSSLGPYTPLVVEAPDNIDDRSGVNILYADGHVAWLTTSRRTQNGTKTGQG